SICGGSIFYSFTGDDVGERGLMAWPGSEASRKIAIDERDLPLRPPEVGEETTPEEALLHWREFFQTLQDDSSLGANSRVRLWAKRKRKVMARAHGEDAVVLVTINLVLDGGTFDKIAAALRPYAGPSPDDFFAYSGKTPGDLASMNVVLSPVTDRKGLV